MTPQAALRFGYQNIIKGLRREEKTSAWYKADLSYLMWPVQKKMASILESGDSRKKVLNCSRRLRKSSTALIKAFELALKKKEAQIRYAAPTREMLRKIAHPIVRLICRDAPSELKPYWKTQDKLYYFPSTGSELHIFGVNNGHEDDARGTASDLFIVDEAQLVNKLRYIIDDVAMPQLITTNGKLWMLLTPPKTPVHECMEYVQRAKEQNAYAEYNIYESQYDKETIDEFCKEAGGEESTTWKREYMCQFVVDTNFSIIPEWNDSLIEEYVPDEFYKFYHKYVAMDIGFRDFTAVIFAVYDFKSACLYILDEFVLHGNSMTTDRLAEMIKAKEKKLWDKLPVHLRVSDNNNLILLNDLGSVHQTHFMATSKDNLDAMVNEVRLLIKLGKIKISPKCNQLIGGLKFGVWDDQRKEFERSAVYGHFDALAALIYLARNLNMRANPIPASYGLNSREMFIPKELLDDFNDQSVDTIHQIFNKGYLVH